MYIQTLVGLDQALGALMFISLSSYISWLKVNEHLMTGPEGNKNRGFPWDQSLSVLLYLPTQK